MEVLFYILKVIICSGVLQGYYYLSLKDKTFHHYNRFYLLFSILISLLLPLIKLEDFTIEVNQNIYMLIDKVQNFSPSENVNTHENLYFTAAFSVLGLISVYFLGKFIYGTFKIHELKRKFERENIEGINFYRTDLTDAPFSYFKNLFWKNSITLNSEIGKQILKHEMVHIEQKHTFDKIILAIITSVFWFNPFYHLIKKEINLIHEYLADKKAVRQSDTKAFAQMLLASHFSGTELPATSPFLSSNLKKRLTMLQKSQTKFGYARRILALPVVFTVAFAYMVNAKNKEIAKTNLEIEKAVSQIKKDTIRPDANEEAFQKQLKTVDLYNEALKEDHERINKISEKINEKSAEIQKLIKSKKTETPEFEAKQNEIEALSDQIDEIVNSEKYKKNLKALEDHYSSVEKYYDSPEFKMKIAEAEKKAKEAEAMVNSPVFKRKIAEAEEAAKKAEAMVNSPEFKRKIKRAEKAARKAEKEARKIGEAAQQDLETFYKDAEKKRQDAVKKTAEDKQKLTKTIELTRKEYAFDEKFPKSRDYEKNPLSETEKELLKKEAKKIQDLHQNVPNKNNFAIFRIDNSLNKIVDIHGAAIEDEKNKKSPVSKTALLVVNVDVPELYVNGKKVSKEEFLKYQSDFKDENSAPNIKLFKIDRVGDSKRSYAKRMEITTY
ncbi:MAG: M56 family metallopeptidase [Candidatus Chryseobacterium colombiense]|nr:M56 family metallopeptidase [Chryseobacterium sp.]WEK70952.1 MAG: M56 family metallopeptidase [Chryseobacterium sp.]